jgi:hypothetical protein
VNRRKYALEIVVITALATALAITTLSKVSSAQTTTALTIRIQGKVEVNGKGFEIVSAGKYDSRTGAYELSGMAPSDSFLSERDKVLVSFISRNALAFLSAGDRESLLEKSDGSMKIHFLARRKVDRISTIEANIELKKDSGGVLIRFDGALTTTRDSSIEVDGESILRLGVNPDNRTFVGGARINYDVAKPDPAHLGTADFWNLEGSYEGARMPITSAYAHVDQGGGDPSKGLAKGLILNFPSSTVFEPGIITLSGVAKKDGTIYQFEGLANQAGGGHTILTFPVRITKGMTAAQVATLVADGFNRARTERTNKDAQFLVAVQGGDGLTGIKPDVGSSRVAVSMTVDNGKSIAAPTDAEAARIFSQSAVQSFSDQLVSAAENTGIRNQFGVLGQPPLRGWLTPFKVVFTTDNPATGFKADGGTVAVLLNWTENAQGRDGIGGNTTSFPDLVIQTRKGDTAEEIVTRLTARLKQQRSKWGSHPFIQRAGNVLYIDAGIDFPHAVSLASSDDGVGYMSAAADLPFFVYRRE